MGGRTGPAPDFSQHLWYRAHSSVPDSLLAAAAAAADPPRTEKLGRIAGIGHRITGRRSGMINRHRGIGSEYLHVAVDDASCLAYTEILPDERKASTIAFLEALAWFARHGATVERIMTDHGNAYRSHDFRAACARASVRHLRTKPDTPRPARPAHHPARPFLPTSPPSAANGALDPIDALDRSSYAPVIARLRAEEKGRSRPPFRQRDMGTSKLLRLRPRIVLRVHVLESPWSDGADLYDRLFVDEDIVRRVWRKGKETARGQGLGLALISRLSHAQTERPRNHRDNLIDRVRMRRDAIAIWQLEPERKQAFLARIAEQDRRLCSRWKHGGRRAPFDLLRCNDRVPVHRLGRSRGSETRDGDNGNQRRQCDLHE
jgi:hypothetical protein